MMTAARSGPVRVRDGFSVCCACRLASVATRLAMSSFFFAVVSVAAMTMLYQAASWSQERMMAIVSCGFFSASSPTFCTDCAWT